jgi:hypothetical protein
MRRSLAPLYLLADIVQCKELMRAEGWALSSLYIGQFPCYPPVEIKRCRMLGLAFRTLSIVPSVYLGMRRPAFGIVPGVYLGTRRSLLPLVAGPTETVRFLSHRRMVGAVHDGTTADSRPMVVVARPVVHSGIVAALQAPVNP